MQTINIKGARLSPQQSRLWHWLQQRPWCRAQCALKITGDVQPYMLQQALQHVVDRHEILQTTFTYVSGLEVPLQTIGKHIIISCPLINIEQLSDTAQQASFDEHWQELLLRPFDLEHGPLLYAELLRLAPQSHLLILSLHALCADATTLKKFSTEVLQDYGASLEYAEEMQEDPLQYVNVTAWLNEFLQEEESEEQSAYWRKLDLSCLSSMPLPFKSEKERRFLNDNISVQDVLEPQRLVIPLHTALQEQVQACCQQFKVSTEAVLLATWQLLLWRLLDKQDFLLGLLCDGRPHEDLANLIGLYARTVPLYVNATQQDTFLWLMQQMQQSYQLALEEQLHFLSDVLSAENQKLLAFPVSFAYESWPDSLAYGPLTATLLREECWMEPFQLQLCAQQSGSLLQLQLLYDVSVYTVSQVHYLSTLFVQLLEAATRQPETLIGLLPLLSSEQQARQQARLSGQDRVWPFQPLHQLFEAQARCQPGAPALRSGSHLLSYQQLDEQSNQLAHLLQAQGLRSGDRVVLCLPRDHRAIVSLLAVLKAGGTYVPLDADLPVARLQALMQALSPALLLTTQSQQELLGQVTVPLLLIETLPELVASQPVTALGSQVRPQDLAYVMYTSGSTGMPKGVMISQQSVSNYTQALCELLALSPGWQVATVSSLAADLGNTAIFCGLASGGCVHVLSYEQVTDAVALSRYVEQFPLDVLKIVPSHLHALLTAGAVGIVPRERLIVGGEALPWSLLEQVREQVPTCQIYNHYGPTETTVGVLVSALGAGARGPLPAEKQRGSSVPIGGPIANTQAYVLDEQQQWVPMGVVGELYIGGAGVGEGYWQNEEQTEQRFVQVQMGGRRQRLYRTGDWVREREEGVLEFVGRRDEQVKIRGYRIELGEIEEQLRRQAAVREAVVVVRREEGKAERLVGYVVLWKQGESQLEVVREGLEEQLPSYMVPGQLVVLERLPLTANGKIDRQHLPEPVEEKENVERLVEELTPLEELLVGIWEDLLEVEKIGKTDNFFQLGGHSLLGMRLMARLLGMLGVEVPIKLLFEAPTLNQLARKVEAILRGQEQALMLPIVSRSHTTDVPLSYAQQRLWFLDQLQPGSAAYTNPSAVRLRGPMDRSALARALNEVIVRHEILRTTFPNEQGTPVQHISPMPTTALQIVDLTSLPIEEREGEARRLAQQQGQQSFDLAQGPLMRAFLLQLEDRDQVLLLSMHHIISDGWSNSILVRELTILYAALCKGEVAHLPELPVQYADYALWQREWLQGKVLEQQQNYWKQQLAESVPLELPTDYPRPTTQTFRGAQQRLQLSMSILEPLRALSQQAGVTLFMTLLAAFQVLLSRYSDQQDISLGTPIANRTHEEVEGLIGFFVNILVMRTDLAGDPTFFELLERVRAVALGAYTHRELPFENVVDVLQPERDLSRSLLFQVHFALQNTPVAPIEQAELQIEAFAVEQQSARFDLSMVVSEDEMGLNTTLQYNIDLFKATTIERMLEHWRTLLAGIIANPSQPLSTLPLLTLGERTQILIDWNTTRIGGSLDRRLPALFEEQVERDPDAIAVVFEQQQMTYQELNARANRLAHRLKIGGVGADMLVGVCMERSLELVIALLAVLKAGGAYVPLDSSYPLERLAEMIEEIEPVAILVQPATADLFAKSQTTLCLDTMWETLSVEASHNLSDVIAPEQLCYMIYTSGSTGKPKGVMNTHQGVCNTLGWMQETFRLGKGDAVIQNTTFTFDPSIWEIFWPLSVGARLIMARPEGHRDSAYLVSLIQQQQVTTLSMVPSMLQVIVEEPGWEQCQSLQRVICGGEALSYKLQERFFATQKATLQNIYGPTEAAIEAISWACERDSEHPVVPIGAPITNVQAYLFDRYEQLVPIGVPGEIYIGGVGLARGYWKRAGLTAERFVPHPFSEQGGDRLYRTGDLGRYRQDGTIEFLGRVDQQVKLRGFRIEPGEIEVILRAQPDVCDAIVMLHEEHETRAYLIAYVIPSAPDALSVEQVHAYLRQRLPDYMIPAGILFLDAFPLTVNGKIDRQALPSPQRALQEHAKTFESPRTSVEVVLATIWSDLLEVDSVGIHDNFFSLGGDSILSIQVVARARLAGLQLTPGQIFQYPTISQLAAEVVPTESEQAEQALVTGLVPLTPIQHWFFARHLPEPQHFNQTLLLEAQQPLRFSWFQRVLWQVLFQHDALRLRFIQRADGWQQEIAGLPAQLPFICIDLSMLPQEMKLSNMTMLCEQAQKSFDLSDGCLLRSLAFIHGSGISDHLLLTTHHLAIDGVSWRIILEDLETAYRQLADEEAIKLAAKTTSWQEWGHLLAQYALSEQIHDELSYWLRPQRRLVRPFPVDMVRTADTADTVANSATISVSLTVEQTQALLREVPDVYHTQINDVLLAALALALADWTGQRCFLIDLEGHGREEIDAKTDISRTVGWFTTQFPVFLDIEEVTSLADVLKVIKEQLRQVPRKGSGYGMLRYMHPDREVTEQLANQLQAQVRFNYLGQFDTSFHSQSLFRVAHTSAGSTRSPQELRSHPLAITGQVAGGVLSVVWQYSRQIHHAATIQRIAQHFIEALASIIAHCTLPDAGGYTPSDFPLVSLHQQQLDRLIQQTPLPDQIRPGQQIEDIYPLSPMQAGFLFHSLYTPDAGVYYGVGWTIQGPLNKEAWLRAWHLVVNRHSIFRTHFLWQGLDQPLQIVNRQVEIPYYSEDWSALTTHEQQQRLEELRQSEQAKGFDLDVAPWLRLILIRLGEKTHYFHLSFHHLLLDGWSKPLVFGEVQTCYRALLRGEEAFIRPVRPYRDYITWLQQQDSKQAMEFWKRYLAGFSAPTTLTIDRHPNVRRGYMNLAQSIEQQWLTKDMTAALQSFGRRHQLTLNTILQGAWALLLACYSGEDDVVFGTTVAGRPTELVGVETMVGLFINSLPVRVHIERDQQLLHWLTRLQEQQVEARQYEYTPLAEIQRWSEVPVDQPLFESLILFQNYPTEFVADEEGDEFTLQANHSVEQYNYALTVKSAVNDGRLMLHLAYDSNRFSVSTIAQLIGQLQQLLVTIVANAQQRLADISLITAVEQEQVLDIWNATRVEFPDKGCFTALFEDQVKRTPDAIALLSEDGQLSYQTLDQRASQLAFYLRHQGVGPEELVGVYLHRTPELLVALLGIFKAGGTYVPLDPAYPSSRLAFILQETQARVVLTQHELRLSLPACAAMIFCLDRDWSLLESIPTSPVPAIRSEQIAYVIYTSGSTGQPKGVMIEHGALRNFLLSMQQDLSLSPCEIWCAVTSISFDIAALELYLPLLRGARVGLVRRDTAVDGPALAQLLEMWQCGIMQATPATWRMLLAAGWTGNQPNRVLCGGEQLPLDLARQLSAGGRMLLNLYGPTETTIWSSYAWLKREEPRIPIGRPIANTQLYVLDRDYHLVPIGAAGELYIGGTGLARGYWQRADLTAERFTPDPFSAIPGARLYRTGDRVCYLADGQLEYLGRFDQQVKVRGYRIELGEIEALLMQHEAVRQAIVLLREDTVEDRRLVAYLVAATQSEVSGASWSERKKGANQSLRNLIPDVRKYLQEHLPGYMIPTAWVVLDQVPLTPNGKIDRRALPAPNLDEDALQETRVRQLKPMEELVLQVWQQVLSREHLGVQEHFFEAGGHSLLATQVIARLQQLLGREISLRMLFEAPTVQALAARLEEEVRQNQGGSILPIVPVSRTEELPLSYAQQRLWFLDQLEPGVYTMPIAARLHGQLKHVALMQAFAEVIQRHENLRTAFPDKQGRPVQHIAPEPTSRLMLLDLRSLPMEMREREARQLAEREAERPFDLVRGPLLRSWLLQLEDHEHILLLTMHHIISDGWSNGILLRELSTFYTAACEGVLVKLPALPVQYADYALWQRSWLKDEILQRQLDYWRQKLADAPPLEFPTDHTLPLAPTSRGEQQQILLPTALYQQIRALALREGVTVFMVLLAAFQVLLARYCGQEDIVVGTPIANRTREEVEGLIGFFVNTLVLRSDLSGNPTFVELLAQVREVALQAYMHQDVPFEQVVELLRLQRDRARSPLFQVLFALQNVPEVQLEQLPVVSEAFVTEQSTIKFELSMVLTEGEQGLHTSLRYATDLFEAGTMARLLSYWQTLLEGIVANPQEHLTRLPLLTENQQEQMLTQWNATQSVYPHEHGIHELFEEQVRIRPDAVALFASDAQITYAALNQQANQVAHYLQGLGVKPDMLVGISIERSVEMVIGLLGILKAGGAYVPLDPNYPSERLAYMLNDAHLSLILTQHRWQSHLPENEARLICLDTIGELLARQPGTNVKSHVGALNLAYVMYTSGSTGQPKGISITHQNIARLVCNTNYVNLNAHDRMGCVSNVAFDALTFEIWGALTQGAQVVCIDQDIVLQPARLAATLRMQYVSTLFLTTALLNQIVQQEPAAFASLRQLLFGGDAVDARWVRKLLEAGPAERNLNAYGPTESTTFATWFQVTEIADGASTVPIGKPIANTQTYVLDEQLQPVPIGVIGELYLGGDGLARGYLNRTDLTADCFVPHPFSPLPGARLYRTGDLVRAQLDGSVVFLGRKDGQIKLRGYRIEAGEIEAVLSQHPAVHECVVMAREDVTEGKCLVAYVATREEKELSLASDLRRYIQGRLPDYMVPAFIITLERLPLTANGKVDRRVLASLRPQAESIRFVYPRDDLEYQLRRIWEELLGVCPVSVTDNFFELGGHSVLAVQLMSSIRRAFECELPLSALFQHQTIAELAILLREPSSLERQNQIVVPLQPYGNRKPFFCVHPFGGGVFSYRNLARSLGTEQPFYGIQMPDPETFSDHFSTLEEITAHYVTAMRVQQPQGPYQLGGWSLGGLIAYEMAQQLRKQGHEVSLLALIDSNLFMPDREDDAGEGAGLDDAALVKFLLRHYRINISEEYVSEHNASEQFVYVCEQLKQRDIAPRDFDIAQMRSIARMQKTALTAGRRYTPQPYPGQITLFRAKGQTVEGFDADPEEWSVLWEEFAMQGLNFHLVPGNHETMLDEPYVGELASLLTQYLMP